MSFDIQILVNGSRCKQYSHEGKTFIEAKHGSEYTIEIKNNTSRRILAVCSVDGLDIISGKPALETSPGYVISAYNSGKFDGFRVSDNKVAKFMFDTKQASYAASKHNGSEKNVGVIGMCVFNELFTEPTYTSIKIDNYHYKTTLITDGVWGTLTNPNWYGSTIPGNTCDATLGFDNSVKLMNASCTSTPLSMETSKMSKKASNAITRGFDTGTKWGESKDSKVTEVTFTRNMVIFKENIYYASRESLIEMGVPIGNEKQINFPESFADSKYAKPPSGWTA